MLSGNFYFAFIESNTSNVITSRLEVWCGKVFFEEKPFDFFFLSFGKDLFPFVMIVLNFSCCQWGLFWKYTLVSKYF